ncbi:MAG: hypothetical protein ABIP93_13065, partial [Gemmatimonadaceae bacterium]
MNDPHGPTRVLPPTDGAVRQPSSSPDDYRLQDARQAAGTEYDVLGEICEVGEGKTSGIAYLAQRRGSTRLDVLRLPLTGEFVEVLGTVGDTLHASGELCPSCGAPIRAGVRFCGNCRANLTTVKLSETSGWMSVAEWLETKSETARHNYQLLGQIDEARTRAAAGAQSGAGLLIARTTSTSRIVGLLLERPTAGNSAIVSLDQTNLLPRVVESLFDTPAAVPTAPPPVAVRAAVPQQVVAPPVTMVEPPQIHVAPPAPPPPPPPSTPSTPRAELPWLRIAAITLSGAAFIAALAWLVTAISSRKPQPAVAVVTDSVSSDTVTAVRADTARPAAASIVDSATLQIASDLPSGTVITVDRARTSRRTLRLSPGRHTLSASAPGYRPERQTLDIRPGEALVWPSRALVVRPKPADVAPPPPVVVASACADASRKSDWARALDVCAREASSSNGNALAERTLGTMYERGLGVAPSLLVAAVWYAAGAGHGDREAQYRYAVLLQNGTGVRRNPAESAQWYLKAADRGHAESQYALGMLYANGEGVSRSDGEAAKWLKKA